MVGIDPKDKKYAITFKRKDLRPNKRDDKLELFRHIIGLEDVRDILDLSRYTQNHAKDPIRKTSFTVTDINKYETPFIMARLSPDQVGRLRRDPNVLSVDEDIVSYADAETIGYQVPKLGANTAWAAPLSVRGAGVNVGIIDTGVIPHLDINANLKINQNFTARPGTQAEDTPNYHGTHVAGITGAVQGNNEGIAGIAPSCNIFNLRAGDNLGSFQGTDQVEAIIFGQQNGVHVLNMSLSGAAPFAPRTTALQDAFNAGITSVSSAGNTGIQETARYPAADPGVLSISNLSSAGDLPHPSSSFGVYVDFTAPGHDIVSLSINNTYQPLTGTSMSSPGFAGVVALMYSAYADNGCPPYTPGARKNQVIEQVLIDTAKKTGLTGAGPVGQRDIFYGYGLPVANQAVAALKGVLPSALA